MTEWTPYSLPAGAKELSGGVAAGGRIVAWERPDAIFVWRPAGGWKRLEEVPPAFDSLLALPMATVVATGRVGRLGLWWEDSAPPRWWEPGPGARVKRVAGDGRYVATTVEAGAGRSLCVLEATEQGWSSVASLPFPQGESLELISDLGDRLEVVTDEGLWSLAPGSEGWALSRICEWPWDGRSVSRWLRVRGEIAVESRDSNLQLVDRVTGERTPTGVRLVEWGDALVDAWRWGSRERLGANVDFLSRLPRSWGRRAVREVLLLGGAEGPVAALTPFGVIAADSEDLMQVPVWQGPPDVFVMDPADLAGWRLAVWPEDALPDASRQVVERPCDDLVYGLFRLFGERATGAVIRSVRGGDLLEEVDSESGLTKLVALCGRRADEEARDGLRSEDANEILVSLAVLKVRGSALREEGAPASDVLVERLGALVARPEKAVRREALRTIGGGGWRRCGGPSTRAPKTRMGRCDRSRRRRCSGSTPGTSGLSRGSGRWAGTISTRGSARRRWGTWRALLEGAGSAPSSRR